MRTLKNRITNLTQSERMGVSPEDDFDWRLDKETNPCLQWL
jgi:hypothetical protein